MVYNHSMENKAKFDRKISSGNYILIGMMGAGKSTMGRTLAKQCEKTFVDSDTEIQHRTGVTIPHIFDVEGEAGFRQREAAVIEDILKSDNVVLATGGGAILLESNRRVLQENGIVVYLQANVNDLWQRTRHDKNRPLLQTENPHAKLTELFALRDPLYQEIADVVVQTGKQSVNTLMLQLVDKLEEFRKEQLRLAK